MSLLYYIYFNGSEKKCLNEIVAVHIKPRPNDRNMSTQHIATLLGATDMLRAFGHHVATCCDMLRHAECCWLKFDHFQT